MKEKKIFITNDYISSQYLWLTPVLIGYCKINNIKKIVFEGDHLVLKKKFIKEILFKNNIKINFFKKNIIYKLFINFISYLLSFFFSLPVIIFFKKSKLLNHSSWFMIQYLHGIWDLTRNLSRDHEIYPSLITLFKSILVCNKKLIESFFICSFKYEAFFIGHTVYSSRISLAVFRLFKNKIFAQANWNIYELSKIKDSSWSIPGKLIFFQIMSKIDYNNVEEYWKKRLLGLSNYEDANISSKILLNSRYSNYKNVLILHIFRDSPFNYLDKDRIFIDYYDWVTETLKIISYSKERWIIRLHPNCKRWGEDSYKITKLLFNEMKKLNYNLNNVVIDNIETSNNEMFKNASRIITFSGTSHLEAACYGIKPIIISHSTLNEFNKFSVVKPKNITEYKKLLLLNSNDSIFKLKKEDINFAKKIIFIRENVLSFKKELNGINIYKGDNHQIVNKEFNIIEKNILKQLNYFFELGKWLGKGNSQTISKDMLNKLLTK